MIKYTPYSLFLAQTNEPGTYGNDFYSSDVYGQSTTTSQPAGNSPQNDGQLANTGYDIVLPLVLGAVLIAGSAGALLKMYFGKAKRP